MSSKGKGLGLFSKLSRKSLSDLSEWNKNDDKLMQYVEQSNIDEIGSLLKKKKVCPTKLDPQGHSALHVAAMRNKFDVVQMLLVFNANVTAVDFQGRTALHCAARHGASEVLEVLSHSKEDDWPMDENNMTALHHACIGGNLDCVINLIRKYPKDIQSGDEDGRTPLFYAAQIGHLNVCKELLDRGAYVNAKDRFGRTALMCAAENGNRLICELFVEKGADIAICDTLGRTASWHAMDAGHTSVKQTIEPQTVENSTMEQENSNNVVRQRDHSPIPEENESVMGDEDTLPLRFRSADYLDELGNNEEAIDDVEIDIDLSGGESDEEFKTSTLSDTDEDGSISPRLSELSYTMSNMKGESSIGHHMQGDIPAGSRFDRLLSSETSDIDLEVNDFAPLMYGVEVTGSSNRDKPIMVTDLDADDSITQQQMQPSTSNSANVPSTSSVDVVTTTSFPDTKPLMTSISAEKSSKSVVVSSSNKETPELVLSKQATQKTAPPVSRSDQGKSDILLMEDGISLSTNSSPSSDEDTDVANTSSSQSKPPTANDADDNDLQQEHNTLLTNYNSLMSEYTDMVKRLKDLEKDRRRHSQEEQEVTEQMDMVLQMSELSSRLDDEQSRNKQLQAQINTLENLAAGAGSRGLEASQKKYGSGEPEEDVGNWFSFAGAGGEEGEDDSDDEFGFPGLCLLNNSTGKQGKDEVRPVAKVSGRPRQMSLKEENREIAKLKTDIESLERQKYSLTEALTHLQSKYEESEHTRKKLVSEMDITKTTLEVKSQENLELSTQNADLKQNVNKYKERSVAAIDQSKSYKREVERLGRKLELYDREYRKVKDRLKRKDANEKRMLKDRQTVMRKLDETTRRMKESERAFDILRQSSHEEVDDLLVKCEELESEMVILRDFNEDQNFEIERLTELSNCGEEMLDLKQLEIQSLERQITLLRDGSITPQRRDSLRDTQKTISSLQEQIAKLQSQLAETAKSYQDTIDVYRNNLIMASKNLLDPDVKEALLHVIELRKVM